MSELKEKLINKNQIAKEVKKTLESKEIHEEWIEKYRTKENLVFNNLLINKIIEDINLEPNDIILDAGCGSCKYSIIFANKGFSCVAVDFSQESLDIAQKQVDKAGLQNKIKLKQEDLTKTSFRNNSFNYIFCWGVLMHNPELESVVSELSRILKKGGKIVIGESNSHALESLALNFIRNHFYKSKKGVYTKEGIEFLSQHKSGMFFCRIANIKYLTFLFKKHGISVEKRYAGEFTNIYSRVDNIYLRKVIHTFNHFYFKYIRFPQLSIGNVLVGEKII